MDVILASSNKNKTIELQNIFGGKINLMDLQDINFKDKIEETGNSFIENALIKCKAVYDKIKKPVLSDDSGLCVDVLGGKPGVYSARYGGPGLNDKQRYEFLLEKVKAVTDEASISGGLGASFVCALVLYVSSSKIYIIQEEFKGEIVFTPVGENGFGYDPVFYVPELKKTAAQLSKDEKNNISHRGRAAKLMSMVINNSVLYE